MGNTVDSNTGSGNNRTGLRTFKFMKVSELRIGNWITVLGSLPHQVTGYHIFMMETYRPKDPKEATHEEITQPIPLTEEWLLKFGFEKKPAYGWKGNGYDYQPETSKTEYQDYVLDAGDEDYFFVRYNTWSYRKSDQSEWIPERILSVHKGSWYKRAEATIPCKTVTYVHQLQNLYFALTGDELTIKE